MVSDAGEAPACRRRDFLISLNSFRFCLSFGIPSGNLHELSLELFQTFFLVSTHDGASKSCDRKKRQIPAIFLLLQPLSPTRLSKFTEEKTHDLNQTSSIKSASCFVSANEPSFLEAFTHRSSSTARILPYPVHQVDHPWLTLELSESCWFLEALGPSPPALSPVISLSAQRLNLILLDVPSIGPEPLHQHQLAGPSFSPQNSISFTRLGPRPRRQIYGPSLVKPKFKFEAQLPYKPRSVSITITLPHSLILMSRFFNWIDRGLKSGSESTSMGRMCNNLIQTLKQNSLVSAPPESYTYLISLTARNPIPPTSQLVRPWLSLERSECSWKMGILGPLVALCLVMLSTAHDHFQFWIPRPRFDIYNLLSQTNALIFRFFELIELGQQSSHDSINLACLYDQMSRTMCVNHSRLMSEELCTTKDFGSTTQPSIHLGWDHCSHLCSLNYPWVPTLMERNRLSLPDASTCFVPATLEEKEAFSTSQDHLIVTISNLPNLFAEVSSTHHELACGMLLFSFGLQVSMNLSSSFIAYYIYLFIYVISLCFLNVIVPTHKVEELVNFVLLFGLNE